MRLPAPATWLAAALGGSGVLHLVRPRTYEWLVPPELGEARAWGVGSGGAGGGARGARRLPRVRPRTYEWLVPPELGDARAWGLGSGVAEVVTAVLLSAPATRR